MDGGLLPGEAQGQVPKKSLGEIQLATVALDQEVAAGRVKVAGYRAKVDGLLALLIQFDPLFNIATP